MKLYIIDNDIVSFSDLKSLRGAGPGAVELGGLEGLFDNNSGWDYKREYKAYNFTKNRIIFISWTAIMTSAQPL